MKHVPLLALATLLLVIFGTVLASLAHAHDWMPESMRYCCNDKDCKPYPREAIEHRPEGWVIKSTGQVFPDGSKDVHINPRPDLGEVWICHPSYMSRAMCILINPEGS